MKLIDAKGNKLGLKCYLTGRPMWKCLNDMCDGNCIVECNEEPFSCVLGGGYMEFKKIGGK